MFHAVDNSFTRRCGPLGLRWALIHEPSGVEIIEKDAVALHSFEIMYRVFARISQSEGISEPVCKQKLVEDYFIRSTYPRLYKGYPYTVIIWSVGLSRSSNGTVASKTSLNGRINRGKIMYIFFILYYCISSAVFLTSSSKSANGRSLVVSSPCLITVLRIV